VGGKVLSCCESCKPRKEGIYTRAFGKKKKHQFTGYGASQEGENTPQKTNVQREQKEKTVVHQRGKGAGTMSIEKSKGGEGKGRSVTENGGKNNGMGGAGNK